MPASREVIAPPTADARGDASLIGSLDARAKIIGLIGFVVIVMTTPAAAVWAFVLYAALLLFLIGLARVPPAYLAKRALIVAPFIAVVAVFLPFYGRGNAAGHSLADVRVTADGLAVLWNVGAKAVLGVVSMILLGATTPFSQMVSGFERLGAPRALVLIASFMYRYSFVFADEARRMRRAMTARNYRARWLWNAPVLGHMLGALFLRSYSRGERVYVAMLSRGYEGAIPLATQTRLGLPEAVFLGMLLPVTVAIRIGASLWTTW